VGRNATVQRVETVSDEGVDSWLMFDGKWLKTDDKFQISYG